MTNQFLYYLRVRYAECDAQKVVFNARYADYVDVSTVEYLRALGFGQALVNGTLEYHLVKQTVEWKAPARYDQILELSVRTTHLGTTSFAIATDFRVAGDEKIIATAETVNVYIDAHTMAKTSLPAELRAALEKGAPGVVTDHADYLRGRCR